MSVHTEAMIAALVIAQISVFGLIDAKDPITDERRIGYGAVSNENTIVVGCSAPNSIDVKLFPDRYYGPGADGFFWKPNVVYRIDRAKPIDDRWTFYEKSIELGDLFGASSAKAKFIDALAKGREIHFRVEARQGEQQTISFLYEISAAELSRVVRECAPKDVSRLLKEMGSPAAP